MTSTVTDRITMKAIVQDRYGSADVLELRDIEKPGIGDDEVLVRVHAAGVHAGDWHLMAGLPYLIRMGFGLRAPKQAVRGTDVAGTVEAVGKDVTRFRPGDAVFGIGAGAFAEYTIAREDKLAPMPANLSFDAAATVPTSGSTALQGLRDVGKLQPGQKALIIGAAGGVGSFAVQIAKALGAHVTGVCSTTKVDLVRSIGADEVIDYTREDFAEGGQRFDLIFDTAGGRSLSQLRRALAPKGTLVIVGAEGGDRWIGGIDRQLRADRAVAVRGPEAGHVHLEGEERGPALPEGIDRVGSGHAGHRPDLPAGRGSRRHPLPARGTCPGQDRDRP